jgi:pimeloyl-ACP methyl ester carboxylesterase
MKYKQVEDPLCIKMAKTLQRLPVAMPTFASAPVATSCARTQPKNPIPGAAPLLLLHGFDSSSLEWRRLM